ncbi:MFS transporter [Catellatospora sp. NPDC049609]|uniref:MFS transporter n=1 Tax=Catellatospora sp. NPDC049609 TaxID=3155505 RepID=UPI00343AEF0E
MQGAGLLWGATGISMIGDGAYAAAAPLLATTLTTNPLAISAVTAATFAPWLLVGPFAGAWVDRLPRRRVMIVADLTRAMLLALLAAGVLAGSMNVAAVAICAFLITAGQTFHGAAAQAIIPQIIGRDPVALAQLNGRISATETAVGGFVGPPAGSALFAVNPWAPFAVDAASFAASALLLRGISDAPAPAHNGAKVTASIREGMVWLLRRRDLVGLAALVSVSNLASNIAFGAFVLYAVQSLQVPLPWYGLLLAAQAVGAVIGGWAAPRLAKRLSPRHGMLGAYILKAAAFLGLALVPSVWLASVALMIIGATSTFATVAVISARQALVPDHLLGRVVTAFRVLGNGTAPIGALVGGVIATAASLSAPLLIAAVVQVAAVVLAALWPDKPK